MKRKENCQIGLNANISKILTLNFLPSTAWDELMKEDHDAINKRRFNSSYEIIQDFSDYASIQGIIYIFFTYQTWFGKLFWLLVILLMLGLGIYWIVEVLSNR